MKKVGVVSIPREATFKDVSFESFYESFGMNTGNYMFTEAIYRQLKCETEQLIFGYDPKYVSDNFDHVVIPAANWLNSYSDWGWFCDIIDQTEIPVTTIGLGLQADTRDIDCVSVSESSVRLAKLLASKSNYISVRGDFTRDWINSIGIENVITTGCPSLYMRFKDAGEIGDAGDNFIVQSTRYGLDEKFLRSDGINRSLFLLAARCEADMIYQSEIEEIMILLYGIEDNQSLLEKLGELYGISHRDKLPDYIKNHGKIFFDIDEWSSFIRGTRGVIGTRLHGSIISLNSGVPAILIPHDSRTSELVDFAKIPTISCHDPALSGSRSDILRKLNEADVERYQAQRDRNSAIYRAFLTACNLQYRKESLF